MRSHFRTRYSSAVQQRQGRLRKHQRTWNSSTVHKIVTWCESWSYSGWVRQRYAIDTNLADSEDPKKWGAVWELDIRPLSSKDKGDSENYKELKIRQLSTNSYLMWILVLFRLSKAKIRDRHKPCGQRRSGKMRSHFKTKYLSAAQRKQGRLRKLQRT